jgi:Ca2+-binding RTX toxin-like protein
VNRKEINPMRLRLLACTALLFVASAALPSIPVSAAVPRCHGKPATHVMKPGDPEYVGTPDNDVVVGSPSDDVMNLGPTGGSDIACGGGGNDIIFLGRPGSIADGGPGADSIQVGAGGTAYGGSGEDFVVVATEGAVGYGGSGSDWVIAAVGAVADGGSGNDTVEDAGGDSAIALYGGSGSDTVINHNGTPKIDCGSAYDSVYISGATDVRRCENRLLQIP